MSEPKKAWHEGYLKEALERLYERDFHLVQRGKERSAAARLAAHLADALKESDFLATFPDIRVDADYGREGEHVKRDAQGDQVVPDIIVHVPGEAGPNVAAIEIKGWWNRRGQPRDEDKLRGYKEVQHYACTYFVMLEKGSGVIVRVDSES